MLSVNVKMVPTSDPEQLLAILEHGPTLTRLKELRIIPVPLQLSQKSQEQKILVLKAKAAILNKIRVIKFALAKLHGRFMSSSAPKFRNLDFLKSADLDPQLVLVLN